MRETKDARQRQFFTQRWGRTRTWECGLQGKEKVFSCEWGTSSLVLRIEETMLSNRSLNSISQHKCYQFGRNTPLYLSSCTFCKQSSKGFRLRPRHSHRWKWGGISTSGYVEDWEEKRVRSIRRSKRGGKNKSLDCARSWHVLQRRSRKMSLTASPSVFWYKSWSRARCRKGDG